MAQRLTDEALEAFVHNPDHVITLAEERGAKPLVGSIMPIIYVRTI